MVIATEAEPAQPLRLQSGAHTLTGSETRTTLETLARSAESFAASARSKATIRAYVSDWKHFTCWCADNGFNSLPADPGTVALYVADLASQCKPSTISRRLASISIIHKSSGHSSPTADTRVQNVTRGIRRRLGTAQSEARPLVIGDLRRMLAHLPDTVAGARDRALFLVGFAGAFRRSELVAIDLDDLERREEGIVVHLRRSKTDPEATGREVALPRGNDPHTCPIAAIDAWIERAVITDGALFRSVDRHGNVGDRLTGQSVTLVIRRAATVAKIEDSQLSGHSLRAGFATTAAANGASEAAIARQTGHRSMEVLRRYIRHGTVFTDNAVTQVGL